MRTVTFSDKRVAERINSQFVPVWFNRGQGFHNCEKRTESWIFSSAADCYPTRNICTFFLTPDLKVVYYVAGYWGPDLFLEILDAAQKLHAASTPEERAKVHQTLAADLAARGQSVADGSETAGRELARYGSCRYEKADHQHGPGCQRVLAEAFRYRKVVHDALAAPEPVALETVQFQYKYGNPFTEEAPPPPEVRFAKPEAPGGPPPVATRTR